jgi:hypothetical protein
MQFVFVLTHRDQAEAEVAAFPGDAPPAATVVKRPRPATYVAAVVLVLLVACLMQLGPAVAAAASGYCPRVVTESRGDRRLFAAGSALAGIGLLLCVVTTITLVRARRSLRPVNPDRVALHLGDQGLTLRTPCKEFSLAWDGVVAVGETVNLFVLKTPGDLRLALPKRALPTPDAVAELRTALHSRVAPLATQLPAGATA